MNFYTPQWIDISSHIYALIALLLNGLIAILWHQKIYKTLGLKTYEAIQRIHLAETPRLGGLVILIVISIFTWFHADENIASILKPCLISMTPISLIALKEDLFHDVRPLLRLIGLLGSGVLFVINFSGPYPFFEETFLASWFKNPIALMIFYPLALTGLANGSNLTDGVNGLCSVIFLSILGSLLFIAYQVNDDIIMMPIWMTMILITTFLVFNYPLGKIFLGDLGAYAIAFLTGMLTIIFFGRHPEISVWLPVLILIYPITEVAFSILRRLYQGQSIFSADTEHLHIKIFYFLKKIPQLKRYANASVMPLLSLLWIYPLIVIPWVYKKPTLIIFFIPFFWLIYGFLYLFVPNTQKNI
jgi:UDP-GlcNAc:undecaprenyl-phosphate/decaprenyl-phosphate GlcNAc-1-phosphate transferase